MPENHPVNPNLYPTTRSGSVRLRAAGALALALAFLPATPVNAGTQAVTGLEVVVDPPIAEAVRGLNLQDRIGAPFSRQGLLADVRRIQDLGPVARVHTDVEDFEGGKKLFYKVEANPRIASIAIVGNSLIPSPRLLERFASKPGQILDYRQLYADVNQISEVYLEHGLMYAQVTRRDDVQVDEGHITIRVDEYRMGSVEMSGLRPEEARLVRRQIDLMPGEPVEKGRLLANLNNVYQLPFVEDVAFSPRFDRSNQRVDLVLDITPNEARRPWVVSRARDR